MAVPISNVTRRQVYAPSGAGGAGPYAFTFEILASTDIAVFKDDTLLTLTTHYGVTINANGTGSVTISATGLALAPASPTQYAIVGNRTISRTTDFTTGGDFFANTLNDELDQQTIFAQQNAESSARALQAPQTDPTSINMVMPRSTVRANKVLSFDSSGNPVSLEFIGSNRGNWATATAYYVRDLVKDTSNSNIYQCVTAHTSTGAQPISSNVDVAKWILIVDAAAAGTSATNAATSASAAASSASAASTSASAAAASASAASTLASAAATSASAASAFAASYDSFDDRYLGPKASPPTLDNDGDALLTGALYFDTVLSRLRVYSGTAWSSGNVDGVASATDNAIARFDGTSGAVIQNSVVTIADTTGNMAGVGTFNATGLATFNGGLAVTGALSATGNTSLATTPVLYSGDGAVSSGRLVGRYSYRTATPATAYYYDLDNTNTITSADSLFASKLSILIDSTVTNANALTAYGTSYGTKAAGLSFVSGTASDILLASVGSAPLLNSDINAVVVGYTSVGPRIAIQNYALNDDTANAINYVGAVHRFYPAGSAVVTIDSTGLGIGTTANASAILDAQSTTKGVRMPNMTTTQKNAIASPAAGLMVFDTTLAKLCVYSGAAWQTITSI